LLGQIRLIRGFNVQESYRRTSALYRWILAPTLALAGWTAQAQSRPEGQPLWEFGAFGLGVSQQAYPGADQQVNRGLALPYFVYRGQFFRADRETAGLRAIKTPRFELDIGLGASFGARSDEISARRGMPNLGTLVEFGPRIRWNLGAPSPASAWRLEFPIRGVFDLSDEGQYRGLAAEPRIVFQRREASGWSYATSLGEIFADRDLAETFYEVAPGQARPDRPAYEAQAGWIAIRVTASFSKNLSPDWRLFGYGRLDTVNQAANQESPLVRSRTGGSLGFGLAYTWIRSDRSASD